MVRWYNTNTFYHAPIVDGPISSDGQRDLEQGRAKVRPGRRVPHCASLTRSPSRSWRRTITIDNREKVMFAYAEALNEELRTLEKNGVSYVQFSSPALVARFREKTARQGRAETAGGGDQDERRRDAPLRTGFHTFFGDASPYLPEIFDSIPTDDIGFDFTQTDPESLSATKKGIIAGVADARTTYLESVEELRAKVEQVARQDGLEDDHPRALLRPAGTSPASRRTRS